MDHNTTPTSSNPFDFDPPLLDDDELMQLINSVFPQTPQNRGISTVFPASNEIEQTQGHDAIMKPNSFSTTNHQEFLSFPQHNVVEFNSVSASAPSKDEEGKKKAKAMEIERRRRQEMSSLYQELRSLLPADIKRKRSISNLIQEATNHINNLQVGIKESNDKRDGLLRIVRQSAAGSITSSSSNSHNSNLKHNVTVKPCKQGLIEVIVSTSALFDECNQSLRLSKVLCLLSKEGLNVVNCVSSRTDNNLVHTIHAQVDDGRGIDLCLLQQTLTDYF